MNKFIVIIAAAIAANSAFAQEQKEITGKECGKYEFKEDGIYKDGEILMAHGRIKCKPSEMKRYDKEEHEKYKKNMKKHEEIAKKIQKERQRKAEGGKRER